MIEKIIIILSSIPDVVWSGIVASLLTLGGVMLSNKSNTRRLQLQLKHDSQEKSKERQATLRREVYLQAAEEITKASSHLGALPQLDPKKMNLADGFHGFFQTAAKLQLIASSETAKHASNLTIRYAELLLKLIAKAQPIHNTKIDIDICNDLYERNQAEVSRVLALMNQFTESGQKDTERFSLMQQSFDDFQKLSSDYASVRQAHWIKHSLLSKQYVATLLHEMKEVSELQILLTAAIRKELDLETDSEDIKKRLEENHKRMQEQIDTFLNTIK